MSLEGNAVPSSEIWGVCGFGMALGSLLVNVQGCVPVLMEDYHGVSCTGICWLLSGAWSLCWYGGFWVHSHLLMFPRVRSSMMVQHSGVVFPATGFWWFCHLLQ